MNDSTEVRLRAPMQLYEEVRPPGSKSLTNRALPLAALARGRSHLSGLLDSDDSRNMRACLERLGVGFVFEPADPTAMTVTGCAGAFAPASGNAPLHAGAAGTVARFLTALLAACSRSDVELDADDQMRERPMGQLLDVLRGQGASLQCLRREGHLPLRIRAGSPLRGGEVVFARPASSQLVSASVLAAQFAEKPTRIVLRDGTPARPYVDMTLRVMERFGGRAQWEGDAVIAVEPGPLRACDYEVEPDASSASYFLALAAIWGGRVRIPGLTTCSLQGDAAFGHVLARMGARVEQTDTATTVSGTGLLRGIEIDLADMPDMSLTLAAAALFAAGPTTISGVDVLRHHETDRLAAAAVELRKLGARVEERDDGLRIEPPAGGPAAGVAIDTYDDHRMAMAFSLVGDVTIRNPGCVAKTFPDYFERLDDLGMVSDGVGEPG